MVVVSALLQFLVSNFVDAFLRLLSNIPIQYLTFFPRKCFSN